MLIKIDRQAKAEVVPSSSLVEVEVVVKVGVGVEVEVEVWVQVGVCVKCSSVFLLFWVGGWGGLVGEVRYKANLNSSCS